MRYTFVSCPHFNLSNEETIYWILLTGWVTLDCKKRTVQSTGKYNVVSTYTNKITFLEKNIQMNVFRVFPKDMFKKKYFWKILTLKTVLHFSLHNAKPNYPLYSFILTLMLHKTRRLLQNWNILISTFQSTWKYRAACTYTQLHF